MEDEKNSSRIKILCPAKLNLFLKVLSRRGDGYHEIFSLMQPVSLYDEVSLEVEEGSGITVSSDSSEIPPGPENLAYKAAEHFLEATGFRKSVSIHIGKNIPVGAGLGGGSSDAASVLLGLNSVLGAALDEPALMGIGARIGSDVPFFILGCPAVARGRGEVLERVKLPDLGYILINPGFQVSTRWAYNNLTLTKGYEDNILTYSEDSFRDIDRIKGLLSNDLEEVVIAKYPELSSLKKTLVENGACGSLMSGSGPTVFGVFGSGEEAERAFGNLRDKLKRGYSAFLANGL